MKLLITSGPGEDDIVKRSNQYPTLALQARPEDLKHFIDLKVEDLPDYVFNDHLKLTLSQGLLERAGRTFLWVSIVVNLIADLKAPSPRIIHSVWSGNPKVFDELCKKLFSWLIASDLIRRELGTLLEVQRHESLNSRQPQDFVYFIRQSMRDFFHKHHRGIFNECNFIGDCRADLYLARTYIWYLNAVELHQIYSKGNSDFKHALREIKRDNIGLSRNGNCYPGYQKISVRYFFFDYASMV
jgi:hypothetical protein